MAASSFHRYGQGCTGTYSLRCKTCQPGARNWKKNPGIKTSPHPCGNCGGPITRNEGLARLLSRRACCPTCAIALQTGKDKTCRRCNETKPHAHFAPRGDRGRARLCLVCSKNAYRGVDGSSVPRPSPVNLRATLRRRSLSEKARFSLTLPQAERLYRAACALCGDAASNAVPIKKELGYTITNLRPLCRLCRRLTNRLITVEDLLLHAHTIAMRSPLDPKQAVSACPKCKDRAYGTHEKRKSARPGYQNAQAGREGGTDG